MDRPSPPFTYQLSFLESGTRSLLPVPKFICHLLPTAVTPTPLSMVVRSLSRGTAGARFTPPIRGLAAQLLQDPGVNRCTIPGPGIGPGSTEHQKGRRTKSPPAGLWLFLLTGGCISPPGLTSKLVHRPPEFLYTTAQGAPQQRKAPETEAQHQNHQQHQYLFHTDPEHPMAPLSPGGGRAPIAGTMSAARRKLNHPVLPGLVLMNHMYRTGDTGIEGPDNTGQLDRLVRIFDRRPDQGLLDGARLVTVIPW